MATDLQNFLKILDQAKAVYDRSEGLNIEVGGTLYIFNVNEDIAQIYERDGGTDDDITYKDRFLGMLDELGADYTHIDGGGIKLGNVTFLWDKYGDSAGIKIEVANGTV